MRRFSFRRFSRFFFFDEFSTWYQQLVTVMLVTVSWWHRHDSCWWQAAAGRWRPGFPNSLYPSWDSCFVFKKLVHKARTPWTKTETSVTTLDTGPGPGHPGLQRLRSARTSTSWGPLLVTWIKDPSPTSNSQPAHFVSNIDVTKRLRQCQWHLNVWDEMWGYRPVRGSLITVG